MNTTANKNVNKTNAISNRACLLSFIPKRNAEHIDLSEVLECMSRFHSENKKLEIVYDLNRERSILKTLYQDKAPNRLDVTKVIEKLRSMDCGVLIIPTFRTVADKPEICSDILMALHEANIRIISPYDEFDSKEIYDQATAETAELFNDLRKALRQAISKWELGYSKPSVSIAMKKLRESGYITMAPDGAITLNESGMEVALRVYGRHKAITRLFELLGVSPEQAASDACKVEHDLSDETFGCIRAFIEKQEQK